MNLGSSHVQTVFPLEKACAWTTKKNTSDHVIYLQHEQSIQTTGSFGAGNKSF